MHFGSNSYTLKGEGCIGEVVTFPRLHLTQEYLVIVAYSGPIFHFV